jgi:hypothetical protein
MYFTLRPMHIFDNISYAPGILFSLVATVKEYAGKEILLLFLDAFAKLQKATINFAMSVWPSVRLSFCMGQLCYHEI